MIHLQPQRCRTHRVRAGRGGFTIIELLIVVGLLLLLAVMTASAVNLSLNNDKVRSGARQVQSYLEGARDRAIYSKQPRGVRFLLDPTNPRTVSSMAFIAPTEPWSQGRIQLERLVGNGPVVVVRGFDDTSNTSAPTMWRDLYNRGLLYDGSRIQIPKDTGNWYTVTTDLLNNGIDPKLHLTTSYSDAPTNSDTSAGINAFLEGGPTTYLLELPASLLPNQEPVLMPKGSVVHLDRCTTVRGGINNLEQLAALPTTAFNRGDKLPSFWKRYPSSDSGEPSGFDYTSQMDVMFSPRGVVTGPAAQHGIIHLYIADQKDADRDRDYWRNPSSFPTSSAPEFGVWTDPTANGYERGDKVILSVFTRTGAISTHSVFSNTDPFRYAETGEVAGK